MPRKRILVVDDDRSVQRLLELVLRDQGFDVSIAATAEEAERLARESRFDLVVADKNLPGRSGLELTRQLQSLCPQALLVLMTAEMTSETPARLRELGVQAILTKPFLSPVAVAKRLGGLLS